jgi:MOSC domain-containing protein YiiM
MLTFAIQPWSALSTGSDYSETLPRDHISYNGGMRKLLSVNVSPPKPVAHGGEMIVTGIFKQPVDGRVMLRRSNLDGDGQADLRVHGGPDKAVYAYTFEHYDYWSRQLKRDDFDYGQFGENLTVTGMPEDEVHIGDVFRIGQATVQVSQPRVPCFKLGIRMQMPTIVKVFLHSLRIGFYLRVLEEGEVAADDDVERLEIGAGQTSVREICRLLYFEKNDNAAIRSAAELADLSLDWKELLLNRWETLGK